MPLLLLLAAAAALMTMAEKKTPTPTATKAAPLRSPSASRAAFVAECRAAASRVDMQGIHFDLAVTLFDLETDHGTGDIWVHTNNPGSIKSTVGWPEPKPRYKSTRVYPSLEDGIRDWVRLIVTRYPAAHAAAKRRDFVGFFKAIDAGGYEPGIQPPYEVRLASRLSTLKAGGFVA